MFDTNIFPIDSKPFGLSYTEWSIKWWQWISSLPKDKNPAFDWSGERVNITQYDSRVLFLCQTYESVESTPFRKNTIIRGTSIFMPIINWISLMNYDGNTEEELRNIAKTRMDIIGPLEITINGIKIRSGLEKYRINTPMFDIDLPGNNIFGLPSGKRFCISDGYWIFLKPIHEDLKLSSYSSCSSGITKIKVNYDLKII